MKPFPCRFIIYAAFNIFNLSSSSILQLLASISKWSTDKTSSLHHSFTNVSIHFYLILMVAYICHQTQCLKNQCLEVSRLTSKISDHSLLDQTSKTWFKFFKIKPINNKYWKTSKNVSFFFVWNIFVFVLFLCFLFDGDDSNTKWWNQALKEKDLIMWSNKQI